MLTDRSISNSIAVISHKRPAIKQTQRFDTIREAVQVVVSRLMGQLIAPVQMNLASTGALGEGDQT
jgi:hypothetical protein